MVEEEVIAYLEVFEADYGSYVHVDCPPGYMVYLECVSFLGGEYKGEIRPLTIIEYGSLDQFERWNKGEADSSSVAREIEVQAVVMAGWYLPFTLNVKSAFMGVAFRGPSEAPLQVLVAYKLLRVH